MRRLIAIGVGCITISLAGCGGGSKGVVTTPSEKFQRGVGFAAPTDREVRTQCPKQKSNGSEGGQMGCAIPLPPKTYQQPKFQIARPPSGSLFPDVSSWQGNVDWPAVKAWQVAHHYIPGAVFKMGEYTTDPFAARNSAELGRLHMIRIGYWFVRNTGCAHESGQIIAVARALHVNNVVEDNEVPEAKGYDACLTPILRKAGLSVDEYSSPGAFPGGNGGPGNGGWVAAYGPTSAPCLPWTCRPVAWQFTDGQWGPVVDIPGIGHGDVSVNYGMLGAAAPKPKPDPYAVLDKTVRHFKGGVKASEHNTVANWDKTKCTNPVHRAKCVKLYKAMTLLAARAWRVAHYNTRTGHKLKHARWQKNNLGVRFNMMWKRLTKQAKNKKKLEQLVQGGAALNGQ